MEHSHVCGKKKQPNCRPSRIVGTLPRVWEKVTISYSSATFVRNTPTCVGKTLKKSKQYVGEWGTLPPMWENTIINNVFQTPIHISHQSTSDTHSLSLPHFFLEKSKYYLASLILVNPLSRKSKLHFSSIDFLKFQ